MKKSFLILLLTPFLLAGCGENKNQEPTPEPEPQPQPQPEPEPTVLVTSTILTSGNDYKTNFTNGTQFSVDHSSNVNKLTTFLNNQAEKTDLITSLECVKLNSLDDLNKDGSGNRYLTVGSASAEGSMVINTKYSVTKVEIKCVNYHNTYTGGGGGFNCDRNSHVLIDEEDFSLEISEEETPVSKVFSIDYIDGVKSFTIANTDGRVFLESMTISYYA